MNREPADQERFAELLPDLPQSRRLSAFAAELAADPQVVAVWLGGSFARGAADPYSDVDLRMALLPEAFDEDRLPEAAQGLAPAMTTCLKFRFGLDTVLWHILLDDGVIYDLHVQSAGTDPPDETRLVLFCRDAALAEKLAQVWDPSGPDFPPARPDEIARLLQFFWMNQQKGLKVFHRGLPLLAWQGEFLMRQDLIRLRYVSLTGMDPGPLGRMTIHTLTPVIQAVQAQIGDQTLLEVGQPTRTSAELIAAAARLRDEVAHIGRELAGRLGFDYPADAEETVRRSWDQFYERSDHAR